MDSILYTTDGKQQIVEPSNGTDFSLEELQGFVGGYIEIVKVGNNRVMVVNEEGKLYRLPLNERATEIIQKAGHNDYVVGDALVCDLGMID